MAPLTSFPRVSRRTCDILFEIPTVCLFTHRGNIILPSTYNLVFYESTSSHWDWNGKSGWRIGAVAVLVSLSLLVFFILYSNTNSLIHFLSLPLRLHCSHRSPSHALRSHKLPYSVLAVSQYLLFSDVQFSICYHILKYMEFSYPSSW